MCVFMCACLCVCTKSWLLWMCLLNLFRKYFSFLSTHWPYCHQMAETDPTSVGKIEFILHSGRAQKSFPQTMFTGFLYFDISLNTLMFLEIPCQVPCRGMLQSDPGLHRKKMVCIMHFGFQFIILESNTTLLKAVGRAEWEGVELHTKKNQNAMSQY